jgi:hypothetical protein
VNHHDHGNNDNDVKTFSFFITKEVIIMMTFYKRSGIILASIALMIGAAVAIGTGNLQPNPINADAPSSLYKSYNFLTGGDSTSNAYAAVNTTTNISYAADNPGGTSGTTSWEGDYANYKPNASYAFGTRLGGKLVSALQTDNTTAWCNLKTTFTLPISLDAVKVINVGYFGTKTNLGNIYLQSSLDSVTWTTVSTFTGSQSLIVSSTTAQYAGTDIVFSGFVIPANSYLRIGCALTASSTNSGMQFQGVKAHSYTLCV